MHQPANAYIERLEKFLSGLRSLNGGALPRCPLQLYIGYPDPDFIASLAAKSLPGSLLYLGRGVHGINVPQNVLPLELDPGKVWSLELKTALCVLKPSEIRFGIDPGLKASMEQETLLLSETVNMAFSDMNVASRGKLLRLRTALLNIPLISRTFITRPPVFSAETRVLVCGAGPSLKSQTGLIKQFADRIVVIAVGHAVRPLMEDGIIPDIVVEMDNKSYWNWNHAYRPDTLLVAAPSLSPEVAACFNKIFWTASDSAYFNKIAALAGIPLGEIALLKSVTVTALDFAVRCGAKDIALVGNDLCLSDEGSTHSDGSYVKNDDSKYLLSVPGNEQASVFTTEDFNIIRKALEIYTGEIQETCPDIRIRNCTAGGAVIKYTLREALETFLSDSAVKSVSAACRGSIRDLQPIFAEGASGLMRHIETDSIILEHSKKLYFEFRDFPKGSPKAAAIQTELNAAVRSGAALQENGSIAGSIVDAVSSQIEDLIAAMPLSGLSVNGTLLERLTLFRQRYKLMYDFLKDFHSDMTLIVQALKSGDSHFSSGMAEYFPAFRSYAASFASQHNRELGDFLFRSSCTLSPGLDFKEIHKDQDIPTVLSVTLPSGTYSLCTRMSFARETEAENKAFCDAVKYDPAKDAVIFFAHVNWIHAIEFAKKYPSASMMILELLPELMHATVGTGLFWHYLPEKTVIIAADSRFRQWEKLFSQTLKLWKNSGKRILFFTRPETICIPEFKTVYSKLSGH